LLPKTPKPHFKLLMNVKKAPFLPRHIRKLF